MDVGANHPLRNEPATAADGGADWGAPGAPSRTPRLGRGGLRGAFATDLILIHPPAVYDFRRERPLASPFADVVPSTGQFEMYPVGFTSIAAYLERNHYNVRIVNLAYRMLHSDRFDAEAHLRRLRAPVYGIDLHWLPHLQGALAVAELIRRLHPEAAVLLGGLSATYFHRELAELPSIDFVLRGDSTEEPSRQLLAALREGTPLRDVENLTFRDASGTVVANPLTFVPADLDGIDVPAYDYVLRSVLKYRDLADVVPYLEWLKHPTTMILNSRGCPLDCAVCGGSRSAYRTVCQRRRPAYRSPERLVDDVRTIAGFSRSPIFMVHDPRVGGAARARRFFELLGRERPANEMVFELFEPADAPFFELVRGSVAAWSLQLTLESADEAVRARNGKFAYPNEALEASIEAAFDHGCRKLDLFFMVGLPGQTPASALGTVDYCAYLLERFGNDPRLHFYVAPLAPFLDPGSRAFEDPTLGYRLRFERLEDYRRAMLEPTWADTLSYDTDSMTRDDIVSVTYQVAEGLNALKRAGGLIDEAGFRVQQARLDAARDVLGRSRSADGRASRAVGAAHDASATSLCGSDELRWAGADGLRFTATTARQLLRGLGAEIAKAHARMQGRFDGARWRPRLSAVEPPAVADGADRAVGVRYLPGPETPAVHMVAQAKIDERRS